MFFWSSVGQMKTIIALKIFELVYAPSFILDWQFRLQTKLPQKCVCGQK